MSEPMSDPFERDLLQIARKFSYPLTPDLASSLIPAKKEGRQFPRKMIWVSVVVLCLVGLMSALLAVPSVRAQVLEYLPIGVIRIFFVSPTPLPAVTNHASQVAPSREAPTQAELSTATPYPSLFDLQKGETTLDAANRTLGFSLPIPSYPQDLGEPDRVYLLGEQNPIAILVWTEPDHPDEIRLTLYLLIGNNYAWKKMGDPTRFTTVNQHEAVWIEDSHPLELYDNSSGKTYTHQVLEHVLLWADEAGITYRLESNLSMGEAVRVAESLH
jgi:hypothetical protein